MLRKNSKKKTKNIENINPAIKETIKTKTFLGFTDLSRTSISHIKMYYI